jgi:hypothetical protein
VDTSVALGSLDTSLGRFGAAVTEVGLALLTLPNEPLGFWERWVRRRLPHTTIVDNPERLERIGHELTAYLAGNLREFTMP